MAFTVAAASAVNRLLDRLYGRPPYDHMILNVKSDEELLEEIVLLAGKAHDRLQAGWSAARVRELGLPATAETGVAGFLSDPGGRSVLASYRELDEARYFLAAIGVPMCRVCSCTDEEPCEGGCSWIEDPEGLGDLCSACAPEASDG